MVHLRLLDFRTGNPHPLAMKPTLPIMTLDAFDIGLQVQAEVLGHGESILMQMSTGTGQAWNAHDSAFCQWYLTEWKTGRTIRVRTPKNPKQNKKRLTFVCGQIQTEQPCCYGQSFAVVAPDIIAVLQPHPHTLVLCRVPRAD